MRLIQTLVLVILLFIAPSCRHTVHREAEDMTPPSNRDHGPSITCQRPGSSPDASNIVRPDQLRAIYIPMAAVVNNEHFSSLIDLVTATDLNTMVVDVKDATGQIIWDTQTPLAHNIGAIIDTPVDLHAIMSQLVAHGIYPIARIVTFDDPLTAGAIPDWGAPDNSPRWLNPNSQEVRDYITELSRELADMGFPEIMYDGVRFAGGGSGPSQAIRVSTISGFLDHCRTVTDVHGVHVSAVVTEYAVSALGDSGIGHDLSAIADAVNLVSPTIFPSQHVSGMYGITDPGHKPGQLTAAALYYASRRISPEQLLPWLEDSAALKPQGVTDQIRAAEEAGTAGWILFNPDGIYTAGIAYTSVPGEHPQPNNFQVTAELPPNELGRVMILAYHQVGPEESRWCRSQENFMADLQMLYDEGYRLVSFNDYLNGTMNVPAGYSPVVITFDDSTAGQFQVIESDGALIVDPASAVGMLADFYLRHPEFGFAATFYVLLPHPFGQTDLSAYKLRWLVEVGLDIGNHTLNHIDLAGASDNEVQRQIALPVQRIQEIVDGYTMTTLALPYGSRPHNSQLLMEGQWGGINYRNMGVLLVGSDPAASPFATDFNPSRLPRVQAIDSEFERWFNHFRSNPQDRYVSDGSPDTVSFPQAMTDRLDLTRVEDKILIPY